MNLLAGARLVCLDGLEESAFARFFADLGADIAFATPDALGATLPGAAFLVDRRGSAALQGAGWSRARLEAEHPALVHVSITPFGSDGPRAGWRGSELVASALGGTLRVTGYPDRSPVKEAGDACTFHAEMVAASGALAAWVERGTSGLGQHVDISIQEVAFSRNVNGILVWQFDRRKPQRTGTAISYGRAAVRCIWELADGYCFHSLMTGRFGAPANAALSAWMDECGAANPMRGTDWNSYNRSTLPADTRATWEAAMEAFFRTLTRHEIATEGRRRGINATVVNEPADVLADAHLAERGFFDTSGGRRRPGRFVRVVASPVPHATPQPDTSTRPVAGRGTRGPLAGLRVLDFSWALVGSFTTKTLGDLGADVIKVESATRPCLSRIDVQVEQSKAGNFDDKPWFAHMNTSKRSVALDMKRPESREILWPLVDWADVVVENFSPGTMDKLGLGYETLRARNPRVVMASGSVYGQTGPLAQEWGVDGTGAALSGRTFLTGWPDRPPVTPGAVPYGDVIVPYVIVAAVAAAVVRQRATGAGGHLDASMYEICVQQMHREIVAAADGATPRRLGNRDPSVFHQGLYPARGDDRWVAITLFDTADWRRLREHAGLPDAHAADAIDATIARWTTTLDADDCAAALQAAGIAAGSAQDVEDLVDRDPQIRFRQALVETGHPLLGAFPHLRTPIALSATPVSIGPAPRLGEHSLDVARTLCGLGAERIEALRAMGVFK